MKQTNGNSGVQWLGILLLAIPAAAAAQDAYTARPANIRAGPDRSYPLVARLPAGAPLQVMGCLDDWSWCDVIFADNRGWAYGPSLSYSYQGDYVPLYTYAPSLGIPIIAFSLGIYWDQYYRNRPWYGNRNDWIQRRPPPHLRPQGPPPQRTLPPPSARHQYAPPPLRAETRSPELRAAPDRLQPGDHRPPNINRPAPAPQGAPPQERIQVNRGEPPGRVQRAEPQENRPPHDAPRGGERRPENDR